MAEFIYTMTKARKAHGDKVILDDVTMSFYPGAKIGVVGPNGAGKSTILKIMAGLDHPSNGEARLSPGYSVGILMQEPTLNEDKTVLGNVEEGLGQIKADVDRFNAISAEMAEPDADFDTLMEGRGHLQRKMKGPTPGNLTPSSNRPWTPFAVRRRTRTSRCSPVVSVVASRYASCCCRSPTCCCSTSPPTTSTPRACSGLSSTWLPTTAPCWQ